jgi:anti-sigma regulatory factor (Ser/Thr protein kinase)
MNLVFQVPVTEDAGSRARQELRALAETLTPNVYEDVRVLTSELVENSVRYSHTAPSGWIEVAVEASPGSVRVEVIDNGPGFDQVAIHPQHPNQSGWGLAIVDQLADRWGVERNGHTTVWFEISL